LEKFLATSDGVLVKPPKFFKQMQSRLKVLQRRLSRKQKRSNNYEKQRLKVARMHHTIGNTRKDFHFKQAHALCDVADMVFMEDLDYRVSAKGLLGQPMLDVAFGQFRSIVKYVCWKRDKFFAEVNANGTSQTCPECGATVRKDLNVRVHHCPECGYTTDRDVASAQVIRNRGIPSLVPQGLGERKQPVQTIDRGLEKSNLGKCRKPARE
jgi:putative transposase